MGFFLAFLVHTMAVPVFVGVRNEQSSPVLALSAPISKTISEPDGGVKDADVIAFWVFPLNIAGVDASSVGEFIAVTLEVSVALNEPESITATEVGCSVPFSSSSSVMGLSSQVVYGTLQRRYVIIKLT